MELISSSSPSSSRKLVYITFRLRFSIRCTSSEDAVLNVAQSIEERRKSAEADK
ncbi:hypothetical protein QFZ36_002355 [Pseudarthrobacter siccitolerans]|uniref:Uncharacterized protein n=1 Tax=Pseudarthrobacter siccitolerans TaxID=861266 RepID=A0ABU0PNF7_9MICC|nr:hypothetical protein [Pseudarthrobacter siccitolerans]MDQ0693517.1 hypothetical protein [Arthrobacter sp. W4I7]